jgi:hypothetical protein
LLLAIRKQTVNQKAVLSWVFECNLGENMKNTLILLLAPLFLLACFSSERPKEVDTSSPFYVTPPSLLYFKNVRSAYYYQNRKPNTRMDMYKLRKFEYSRDRPVLVPVIVNNWMEEQAYIFIEKNDFSGGFSDSLLVRWSKAEDTSGVYALPFPSKDEQFRFARQIYQSLKQNHLLEVKTAREDWVPVFKDGQDRMNYMTTLRDYERLISKK